jgi:predicted HNH restriction endonuclease
MRPKASHKPKKLADSFPTTSDVKMDKLPTQAATEAALLLYLFEAGSVEARNVYQPLADLFELSPEQRSLQMADERVWWDNRVQWARKALKDKGYLDAARRGVWQLTDRGKGAAVNTVNGSSNAPETEFEEGELEIRRHMKRERASAVVAIFKENLDPAKCAACDFNFLEFYGERGRGFIEAHHLIPIASPEHSGRTKISDLIALCANCHRMIHRKPYVSIESFKQTLLAKHRYIAK